jgi:hypothetical protein
MLCLITTLSEVQTMSNTRDVEGFHSGVVVQSRVWYCSLQTARPNGLRGKGLQVVISENKGNEQRGLFDLNNNMIRVNI